MKNLMRNKGIKSFFIIQISILFLLLLALLYKFTTISTICFSLIIILCFFTYYSLYKVCKDLSLKAEIDAQNTVLIQHNKMQQEHLNALKENEKIWDMIREHIVETYHANTGDIGNKREFINKLIQEDSIMYTIEYCDNKIIDAILYNKLLLAKTKDIQPIVQVLLPENIPISPITLMSVYTNLLDNAIEATVKLQKKDRFLNIESIIKANYLIIKVENSKLPDEKISLHKRSTSKKDIANHGLGIQILQRICKEHRGSFTVDDQGNHIIVTAILQLEK